MFNVLIRLIWVQMFGGGAEMLTNMRTGESNTFITPHLSLGKDQGLFIFSELSLATRWINFNVFHRISYYNLTYSTLLYFLQ